jgi:DnaJ-class molecular chaperone
MIVTRKMADAAWKVIHEVCVEGGAAPDWDFPLCAGSVQAAYKFAAKRTHPDAGGSPEQFAAVDRAKHVLLEWLKRKEAKEVDHPITKCPKCEGSGVMVSQRGFKAMRMQCTACRGTGETTYEHDLGDGR